MKKRRAYGRRTAALAAAALAAVLGASAAGSMAYFTTNTTASGGHPVYLADRTEVEEHFEGLDKRIQVINTGDVECWVRVKIFAGDEIASKLDYKDESGHWNYHEDDGYWYYNVIVPAAKDAEDKNNRTGVLVAGVTVPEGYKGDFDIVVVEECTPVLYHEDGTAYADWDMVYDRNGGVLQ